MCSALCEFVEFSSCCLLEYRPSSDWSRYVRLSGATRAESNFMWSRTEPKPLTHRRNTALTCRHFGISRQTFYRWWRRYDQQDLTQLESRSHRPHRGGGSRPGRLS